MGKMLDIPECDDEADMYPELSSELSCSQNASNLARTPLHSTTGRGIPVQY
jgi:hypothetical protein